MMNGVATSETTCLLCAKQTDSGSSSDAVGKSVGRTIVKTACHHTFHLECIRRHLDGQAVFPKFRNCAVCPGEALPLVQVAGERLAPTTRYCESPALVACCSGDWEAVQAMVEQEPEMARQHYYSARTDCNTGLLHIAAAQGDDRILNLLIRYQANINGVEGYQFATPLHLAADGGHTKCMDLLLAAGANPMVTDQHGDTPLHKAVDAGHIDSLPSLIIGGANINTVNNRGYAPLHKAVLMKQMACLQYLLSRGADVDNGDAMSYTAACNAAFSGYPEFLEQLIHFKADINKAGIFGHTPLHLATEEGHINCMHILIKHGAKIDAANDHGDTSLHMAVWNNNIEALQLLSEKGASVNITDHNGWAPVHVAASEGNIEILKHLLERGANIRLLTKNGLSPLGLSTNEGHTNCVQFMHAVFSMTNAPGRLGGLR